MYSKSRNANKPQAAPKISPVTLALQLVSGERLIAEFHPEGTLWDILQHWEAQNKLDPSLATLNDNIPVCIYMRKEIATKEMLQMTTLLQLEIFNGKAAIRYITKSPGVVEQLHVGGIIAPTPRMPSPELQKRKVEEVELKIQKETSALVPENVTEPFIVTEKQEPGVDTICQLQKESIEPIHITPEESRTVDAEELPSCQELEAPEVELAIEEPVYFLNEQGVLVYMPPQDTNSISTNHNEESDEFFEITEEEVRRMMHDLICQNTQLQNAPLITAQLRREHEEKRRRQLLEKYPTTVLRIQFSNRFILQMPLPSEITLAEVKLQLLEYLDASIKVENFELFTTPPKQIIETSLSLHEIGLTPSSLIYISSHCVLKEQFRLNPSDYGAAVRDANRRLYRSVTTSTTMAVSAGNNDVSVAKDQRPKRPASETSVVNKNKNVPKWLKMNQ
ncbi:tether containing UBX domain for GLUT4-like [Daphnia carinata]|uniref:tether containing UBX domain for GLUT4-like n=1 Tax=Daphnia carinata TaxID=120202 RepID=UPI00258087BA|nr:tether containing UBX domain for GLUT4-like [Daphnia carinata]